ncbi:MAG: DUF2490 domain-containing protein [Rikenellaceae bacterium]
MGIRRSIALLLGFILVGVSFSASAENLSTDKDGVISSLRGRVTSPQYGQFSFFLDQEIRSTNNFGSFRDSRTSVFAVFDPLKWLKVSGGYAFLVKEGDDSPSIKHRYILAFEETLRWRDLKFALRERLETTNVQGCVFNNSVDGDPTNLLRTRLKISYSNGEYRTVPYIYTEIYNHTNEGMILSRIRSQAGVDYTLTSNSKLTAFYQYAHFVNKTTTTAPHTFGLLYAYKFGK